MPDPCMLLVMWEPQQSCLLRRQCFPLVKLKALGLAASLRKLGEHQAVDMDDAGMRFTLDVIALVRLAL